MKFATCVLSIFLFTSFVHASVDDSIPTKKKRVEHELFINTTYFFKQIINLSSTSLTISPYIVGYKCFFDKNNGIRVSVGGSVNKTKQFPDSTFVNINNSGTINSRVGYEYRRHFGKFWTFFTGIDVVADYSYINTKVNSDEDLVTIKSNTWDIGGGPMVGIQINIHKRISLFTETAFYYTYGTSHEKTTSVNFPELNDNKITAVTQNGQFLLPTSVYFVFKF